MPGNSLATETTRPAAILRGALRDAHVKVIERANADARRLLVDVDAGSAKERLSLLWAGEGWPKDVMAALAEVRTPWPRELVVVARRFSPGARRALQERDANWVDESGDANIVGPSRLFVVRMGGGERRSVPESTFKWTSSASAIAETILASPQKSIFNSELATATGFSPPQVSRTLAQFDKQGWTRKAGTERGPGSRRLLVDGDGLLRSWADYLTATPRKTVEAHAIFKDPFEFMRKQLQAPLERLGGWALSGWCGLELVAPFATQVTTLHVYLPQRAFDDGRSNDFLKRSRLRQVEGGGRVILWPADETVLRLARNSPRMNLPVVSPPRLYADLLRLGGRGADASEHVRETLIEL